MVGTQWTFETDINIGIHGCEHINLSFVMESFNKVHFASPDVSKVYKMDEPAFSEILNNCWDILSHQRKIALTHCESVVRAWINVGHAAECIGSCHDA